jgi:uncharacterized membrane protein
MLVVVFDALSQALDGRDALKSMEHDESIALHGYAIVAKNGDGTISVSEEHKHPLEHRTLAGSSITSLIGLLSRSASVIASDEQILALKVDADNVHVAADFVAEVSRALGPGKFALLADIDEEWTPWIDLRMQELGGVVFRCPFLDVKDAANWQEIAATQAELARLRAEHACASADRKAELYEKINALDTNFQQLLENAKKRRERAAAKAWEDADALAIHAAQEYGRNRKPQKG